MYVDIKTRQWRRDDDPRCKHVTLIFGNEGAPIHITGFNRIRKTCRYFQLFPLEGTSKGLRHVYRLFLFIGEETLHVAQGGSIKYK